jgi:hypothetical protein
VSFRGIIPPGIPSRAHALMVVLCGLSFSARLQALVLQAPVGGEAITVPHDRIVCNPLPEGWSADATRRRLRPPADRGHVGKAGAVLLAPTWGACSTNAAEKAFVVTTGAVPTIDPGSVTVSVDGGRLELHGDGLEGARIAWKSGSIAGSDVCLNVTKDKGRELCALNVDKTLPADPLRITLTWAPPGGRTDTDVVTYDKFGSALSDELRHLAAARVTISRVFSPSHVVDVASGEGQVELVHPEAVSSVECGTARCDVTRTGVVVRTVPAAATTVSVRLKLAPRVFLVHGDASDTVSAETLTVLRCPLSIVSGEPLRNVDDLSVLVRLDKSCGRNVEELKWTASGESAEVTRAETLADGVYVLLRIGRAPEHLTIVASRSDETAVLAVTSAKTREAPALRTSLSLPGYGEIGFVPKNRDALVAVSPVAANGRLVPMAVPGAYTVEERGDGFHIRGVYTSGGYTALRFAYRSTSVPDEFRDTSFATLVDPVQRPIREASVPAPLGASSVTKHPIVDLLCSLGGKIASITPGTTPHIPFGARDSCRLVIHRERIALENGEQRLDVDVAVTAASGSERPEAKQTLHLVLRHGSQQDVMWIHGAKEQFDRISVRVTHLIDESEYTDGVSDRVALPSAQWTIVTEDANLKFYATVAIPASLYRFSKDPGDLGTGPLALNFGVLSRLTWLNREGHEGLVGLETGAMAMGLETDKQRQLALVLGLGVSVPLGNINQPTQAAVNIHAWVAYSVGRRTGDIIGPNGIATDHVTLNPWAFVFGPSITIGNIGTFL